MRARLSLVALALAMAAAPAAAQTDWDDPVSPREPGPFYLGGSLTYGDARGDFGTYVDHGWGGSLHGIYRLDEAGIFGLRADAGVLIYGRETKRVPLSSTIGGRVLVDLETSNNLAYLGFGPQIGVPTGRLRPYVNGSVGVSFLWTESSVEGTRNDEEFASTTNFDDSTFSWGGGAGLYVPLRGGPSPISLDLGVRYHNNGRASYLREGGITDRPDGGIDLDPITSDTDLLTFHLGVSVGTTR